MSKIFVPMNPMISDSMPAPRVSFFDFLVVVVVDATMRHSVAWRELRSHSGEGNRGGSAISSPECLMLQLEPDAKWQVVLLVVS